MLDAHFCAGDGRGNENIALTTIHQVFHSEHDRLVDDIKNILDAQPRPAGGATRPVDPDAADPVDRQLRLRRAALPGGPLRHRDGVPAPGVRGVRPQGAAGDPAVPRLLARTSTRPSRPSSRTRSTASATRCSTTTWRAHETADGADRQLAAAADGVPQPAGVLQRQERRRPARPSRRRAAIVMGSSDQAGNELDEFVTETLRNNLLGLPLDLPTINMTRAREAGVPPLNDVRRQIYAETNDGQLAPYTSWSDFGQHLKHPESLINFVAAYGTHPTITRSHDAQRRSGRAAAGDRRPAADRRRPPAGRRRLHVRHRRLGRQRQRRHHHRPRRRRPVGRRPRRGHQPLRRPARHHVQLRVPEAAGEPAGRRPALLPGPHAGHEPAHPARGQLVRRDDPAQHRRHEHAEGRRVRHGRLQVPAGRSPRTRVADQLDAGLSPISGAGSVNDDPTTRTATRTSCCCASRTARSSTARQHVDPSGINGQSVYNGTAGVDRIFGGNDNDTFWGGDGNDVIEGNGGDDVALGGDGNDIITDLDGADVLKGGPGNDAIDGGIGDDILMGGDGQDFINGGANDNETFAGPGNDFVIAGQGADAVFGDGGDDWIQGGTGQDLLQGDHGAPFFDDPAETAPGNDVFVGQVGENDYDAEGGDDLMAQNAAVDRNAGAGGFDWAIPPVRHRRRRRRHGDQQQPGRLPDPGRRQPRPLAGDRGRLRVAVQRRHPGHERRPERASAAPASPAATSLDQAGVDRITGLDARSLPPLTGDLAHRRGGLVRGRRRARSTGPVWGDGNILLGGGGSDTIDGSRRRRHHRRRPGAPRPDQRPDERRRPGHRDRQHRPDGAHLPRPATRRPCSRRCSPGPSTGPARRGAGDHHPAGLRQRLRGHGRLQRPPVPATPWSRTAEC